MVFVLVLSCQFSSSVFLLVKRKSKNSSVLQKNPEISAGSLLGLLAEVGKK